MRYLTSRELLIASYKYYLLNKDTGYSDYLYDISCNELLKNYDTIDDPYKKYIPIESLPSGSLFHLKKEDYPADVVRECESEAVNG